MQNLLTSITSLQVLSLAFLAILFLQSGLDKVFNYKDNYAFFEDHFKKSILAKTIGLLLPVITFLEVAAGLLSAIGIVEILLNGSTRIGLIGGQLSAVAILSLFFGQWVAKDYEGAGSLVGYFIVCMASIFLMK